MDKSKYIFDECKTKYYQREKEEKNNLRKRAIGNILNTFKTYFGGVRDLSVCKNAVHGSIDLLIESAKQEGYKEGFDKGYEFAKKEAKGEKIDE